MGKKFIGISYGIALLIAGVIYFSGIDFSSYSGEFFMYLVLGFIILPPIAALLFKIGKGILSSKSKGESELETDSERKPQSEGEPEVPRSKIVDGDLWIYNSGRDLYCCANCGHPAWQFGDAILITCADLKECPKCHSRSAATELEELEDELLNEEESREPSSEAESAPVRFTPRPPRIDPNDVENTKIRIPGGEFIMGSTTNQVLNFFMNSGGLLGTFHFDSERPQHTVQLDEFEIDKYPVTCMQYREFCRQTGHAPPEYWGGGEPPESLRSHPVVEVTLMDAMAYAQWAGGRIPYETEWEKAARGDDGRIYPWGDEFDEERLNIDGGQPARVDRFPGGASPYGCMDMVGNVFQWTRDVLVPYPEYSPEEWWDEKGPIHLTHVDGSGNVRTDPVFIPSESVIRGGGFRTVRGLCRCASRASLAAGGKLPDVGFRCVYGPDPSAKALELVNQENFQSAIPHIEKALTASPVHAGILYNAAVCYFKTGQTQKAIEHLETIMEHWPDDSEAEQFLDYCRQNL